MKNIFVFTCIILAFSAKAQTFKQYLKAAENDFAQENYYSAMKYFEIAHEIEEENMDVLYKYAESARQFGAYTFADTAYMTVLANDSLSYPMAYYWSGVVKKQTGQYEAAEEQFEKYLQLNKETETTYTQNATRELEACRWAIEVINEPDQNIIIEQLEAGVNTPYSDFAAIKTGDDTYFSSYSFIKEEPKTYPPRQFVKVLKSPDDGETFDVVDFNDGQRHTAHTTFNKANTRLYYTLCDYVGVAEIRCELYFREVRDDGQYGEAVKLPDFINLAGYTFTEPHIGYDEETNKEWLFFVSNCPKGKGKLDVWATMLNDDGSFSQPFNISAINTPENDVTPFFHTPSQTLYFSSDGRQGLGGYDIYQSEKTGKNWGEPEHKSIPLNSSYNDTHFVLNEAVTGGFFSSNRLGSLLLEPEYEACCNDIYAFSIDALNLDVLTFNLKDSEPLAGVTLQLVELTKKGEIVLATSTNGDGNDFNFELKKGKKYALLATKDGFVPLREEIDLTKADLSNLRTLERKLYLVPTMVDLDVLSFNEKSKRALKGVEVRLVENGNEVDFQKNATSNDVHFTLERGKKYELIGAKVAFIPDTVLIDLTNDNTTIELEKKLFLRPKGIEEFPPLLLYFDNDEPNPGVRRATTDKTYEETYKAYVPRKDLFVTEYTKVLEGRDSFLSELKIKAFFDREITNGYQSLVIFTENLTEVLDDGFSVKLEIQGYTSPRADANYNDLLSQRRTNSLRNHFDTFKDGILKQYVENGQLSFEEVGYGEEFAPQFISDRLDDDRESIYSLQASAERKVAIVGVRVDSSN